MSTELTRRSLLAFFGSAGVALAVAKTLPEPLRDQIELALRDIEPPPGISYQWNVPEMITQASQWVKVPDERHGGSEIGGLILCERPMELTVASRQRDIDKALAQGQALLACGIPGATLEGSILTRQGDVVSAIVVNSPARVA